MPASPETPDNSTAHRSAPHPSQKPVPPTRWARLSAGMVSTVRAVWQAAREALNSPRALAWRQQFDHLQTYPAFNVGLLLAGIAALTVLIALVNRLIALPNPGI